MFWWWKILWGKLINKAAIVRIVFRILVKEELLSEAFVELNSTTQPSD